MFVEMSTNCHLKQLFPQGLYSGQDGDLRFFLKGDISVTWHGFSHSLNFFVDLLLFFLESCTACPVVFNDGKTWNYKTLILKGGLSHMSNSLDKFADRLQEEINQEVMETYGEQVYERWRNPRFGGPMENPTGRGRVTGSCGDTMEIFLRLENGIVSDASYTTDGCGCSAVCALVACELAIKKEPEMLTEITGEAILGVLGGLPEDDVHCAFLAAETLEAALDACMRQGS
jgi:nitrogen fixation NifU-like protein